MPRRTDRLWTRKPAITPRGAGGCDFLADPTKSVSDGPVFWNPDDYAKVVILEPAPSAVGARSFILANFPEQLIRHDAEDGAHVMVQIGRIWFQLWVIAASDRHTPLAAVLPLDTSVGYRAEATLRLWRLLAHGEARSGDTARKNEKFVNALRALDAKLDGASYRVIAEALFGPDRIKSEVWKTSSHRDTVIRLVRNGIAMMRGKYRSLLHRRDSD